MDIWREYPSLTLAVQRAHEECPADIIHHDFDHALQVAQVATMIAADPLTSRLAGAAALCHNADRMLEVREGGSVTKPSTQDIEGLVMSWLGTENVFSGFEEDLIIEAVLEHSKPNDERDSPITVTLKDADRVVNLGLDIIVRGAQHHGCQTIHPTLLLDDKRGAHPKRKSMVAVLQDCLEWSSDDPKFGIRLPKAKALADDRANMLKEFISSVIGQRDTLGRHQAEDDADVEKRLGRDHHGPPQRQQ